MKVFITGVTGFVGVHLAGSLLKSGHEVVGTGTRPAQKKIDHENFRYISADTTQEGPWQASLKDVNAVVNLAGRTIFNFWTQGYKKQIYDSRVLTTRHITEALPENKEIVFCSASAAGYYGTRGDDLLTEAEPNGADFLARVCNDWEARAFQSREKGARVVAMRFGVVLGKGGGAMKQMLPAFRFGVGGPLGGGEQWFPWIHLEDLIAGIIFALETPEVEGPLNFTAPNPVRQREFAKTLGRVLKRPAFMPAPSFMIKMMLREFGSVLLASQRAVPEKLSEHGFQFKYPDLDSALGEIVGA